MSPMPVYGHLLIESSKGSVYVLPEYKKGTVKLEVKIQQAFNKQGVVSWLGVCVCVCVHVSYVGIKVEILESYHVCTINMAIGQVTAYDQAVTMGLISSYAKRHS